MVKTSVCSRPPRGALNLKAILVLALSWWLCIAQAAFAGKTYQVGIVPQFGARQTHAVWQTVLNFIEKQTGLFFHLKVDSDIPEFEKSIMAGAYDLAYMNPYHLLKAHEKQGYLPILRDRGAFLQGILVVPKDSQVKSVPDLDQKKVAFPAPNALGACLLMRAELENKWHIKVTPVYVKTHPSVYLNVLLKQTAAGGGVQQTLDRQPRKIRDGLTILYRTRPIAPHPLVVHPRVPRQDVEAIRAAFMRLGQTAPGKKVLEKIPIKEIGEAAMEDYMPLLRLGLEPFCVPAGS